MNGKSGLKILGIIPGRMGSSRFYGKPLKKINGIPMIGHCYYRSLLCEALNDLYVATCDREIYEYVKSINGNVVMTSQDHIRATDRVEEAYNTLRKKLNKEYDLIVMIQGDEPMVVPEMIDAAIQPFEDEGVGVVNLMAQIKSYEELCDPNEIKVVCDKSNNAIYMSRCAIPSFKAREYQPGNPWYKQVCIIPFRPKNLRDYHQLRETPLEQFESIDMLRLLENKGQIRMVPTGYETYSVDCEKDLVHVSQLMKNDKLLSKYPI